MRVISGDKLALLLALLYVYVFVSPGLPCYSVGFLYYESKIKDELIVYNYSGALKQLQQ